MVKLFNLNITFTANIFIYKKFNKNKIPRLKGLCMLFLGYGTRFFFVCFFFQKMIKKYICTAAIQCNKMYFR